MEAVIKQNTSEATNNLLVYQHVHTSFHSMTGTLALVLMLFHTLWATRVLMKKNSVLIKRFHQLSLFVWIIWLVPFITGALSHYGMK